MDIAKAIELFLRHLELYRECSQHTIKSYKRSVDLFAASQAITDASDISIKKIERFRELLLAQKTTNKTKNQHLIALRMFFRYLRKNFNINIAERDVELFEYKQRTKKLNLPSMEDFKKILEIENILYPTQIEVFCNLGYYTGLRLAELKSLKIGDVQETFSVVGKGAKERLVVCPKRIVDLVRTYEYSVKGEKLFSLSTTFLQREVKKHGKIRAGADITPHLLRHMFASTLVSSGANLIEVQYLLGHSAITTTQIYAQVFDERLVGAHKKVFA